MAVTSKTEGCPATLTPPIRLPLRNVSTATQSLRRGIALSIGSPPQILSFKVNPSWRYAVNFDELHTIGNPDVGMALARYGNDTFHINSSYSITGFPFGVIGTEDMNEIGLGHSSILLHSLISAGSITSNVWGYFQGLTGVETTDQLDGSLLLGGYDEAKISGDNLTVPFTNDPSCPSGMVVTISGITMNLANGSNVSIIGASKGAALKSCILPEYFVSSYPQDIWASFVRVSGVTETGRSDGLNDDGELISATGSYDGNLTLTLGSNFEITIPNHQLVLPDYNIDELGQTVISNITSREVLINSLDGGGADGMPSLSQSFLTSVYLFVDNDLEQFTLWRINATERENLIAVPAPSCRDVLFKSVLSTNSPTPPPITATLSSPVSPTVISVASDAPTGSRETISHGAYVAIALSATFLGCLLTGCFLYLKQRRARRRGIQRQETNVCNENGSHRLPFNYLHNKPELPSDRQPPQEMPLSLDPPYTLSPYELETTMSNQGNSDRQNLTLQSNSVDDGISCVGNRSELE